YDFANDIKLMSDARCAIAFLVEHNISKYNNALEMDVSFLFCESKTLFPKRVLIIAQTAGDASLEYGMLEDYTTQDMINVALSENPDARIYLKIHPDVLSGKKKSDIDMAMIDSRVHVITQNVNPIALLKHFDKVYTKTSGMGFEALLVGCECVCFGMPFYAGWGTTDDRSLCVRREKKLTIEEVFAGAYILYTKYYNPYEKRVSDIFDTMQTIVKIRGR
ncbi:MAG: capsular polysaccharide biosynthesis protein, partial [Sulfurimonas sp.]|nr:capsular polysaccharide biosynthesis protein [Sulfurimonas sp.]